MTLCVWNQPPQLEKSLQFSDFRGSSISTLSIVATFAVGDFVHDAEWLRFSDGGAGKAELEQVCGVRG